MRKIKTIITKNNSFFFFSFSFTDHQNRGPQKCLVQGTKIRCVWLPTYICACIYYYFRYFIFSKRKIINKTPWSYIIKTVENPHSKIYDRSCTLAVSLSADTEI